MNADVVDPSTGQVVDTVTLLDADGVRDVVDAAVDAFSTWSRTPVAERRRLVLDMATALARDTPRLAIEYSRQHGKLVTEARTELDRAVDTIKWAAVTAEHLVRPRSLPDRPGLEGRAVLVEPAGPVLAFVPWNFAAVIASRKVASALAMGCSVIIKGPEETPCVARAFVRAAAEAGVPPGAVQSVFAEPSVVAQLVCSPEVRQVTFTGSARVGRIIAALAAENLTPCVLELGGHAPVIVTADADICLATDTLVAAKFGSTGQSCGSPSRFLVQQPVYEEFLDRFCLLADDRAMGPLNSAARRVHVHELVLDAEERGATIRCGGQLPETPGFHYPATVLADVPPRARVLAEEPFGPVAPVLAYHDENDAIRVANDNDYALSAYVFGEPHHAAELAARIDAGSVTINAVPTAFPDAPLGGRRNSGYGYEGGEEGMLAFGRLKILQTRGTQG